MGSTRRLLCVLAITCLGCESAPEGPPTFPVQGRIEYTRGGTVQDLANHDGMIQFQSVDQPEYFAVGRINEDGTFMLTTTKDGHGWVGAVAGKHKGRLNLDEAAHKFVAAKFLEYDKSGIEITVPTTGETLVKIHK
jgi:hypothetical protein